MESENKEVWFLRLNDDDAQSHGDHSHDNDHSHDEDHNGHQVLPKDTLGVALSGGGIRSATFCLGVLQSLAKAKWLRKVDFLSTVSGGGYIGSFLGRFYDVSKRPEVVEEELANHQSTPIGWLRTHSNYLSPRGIGDTAYNLASFWRNLFAVQFVLIVFCFFVLGAVNSLYYYPWEGTKGLLGGGVRAGTEFAIVLTPFSSIILADYVFVSFWFRLAEVLVWLCVIPLGVAYWVVSRERLDDFVVRGLIAALIVSLAILFSTLWIGAALLFAAIVLWVLYAWWSINVREGHGNPLSEYRLVLGRKYLTTYLANAAAISFFLAMIALIDTGGKYLAQMFLGLGKSWTGFFGMIGGMAGLLGGVPLFRGLANYVASSNKPNQGFVARMLKIPFVSTAIVLTLVVLVPLSIVSFFSHVSFELGESWAYGLAATMIAFVVSWLLGNKDLNSFVNNSSNLPIYSSRLARVFLGAVNPERHRHYMGKNVSHIIEGDDVDYRNYQPHAYGGPLHLVNVAVNETIDVGSMRGIRDRQAENFAIGPAGVNIAKTYHALWTQEKSTRLRVVGHTNVPHPLLNHDNKPVDVEALNLREWMAISGAAFSPGMGRETKLARSLLFTSTNLRLGYWWDSNLSSKDRAQLPGRQTSYEWFRRLFFKLFTSQGLLFAEAIAKFGGPWLRQWYLSDGGHFEHTGAYELLRRRVPFIIIVDVGADQDYKGEVLALLTRLARIDFGAEFDDVSSIEARRKGVPPQIADQFASLKELMPGDGEEIKKASSLFKVTYPTTGSSHNSWHGRDHSWVLYVRAAVTDGDEPADVRNYKLENPEFPNQSTLDQFFDEQQWESYRKLGEHIGSKIFE